MTTDMTTLRALVVDDDPVMVSMLTEALQQRGFSVQSLPDGAQVVDHLRRQPPDVVLLDVEMPVFDGIELVSVIANDPDLGSIPLLVVSGSGKNERALQAGATAFFDKPADLDAVANMARDAARRRRESALSDQQPYILLLGQDKSAQRIAAMFKRGKQEVLLCATAQDALALLYDRRPLLVVTDLESAAEQSAELTGNIRDRWRLRDIPIMAMAGRAAAKQRLAALQSGADLLASPPYFPAELLLQGTAACGPGAGASGFQSPDRPAGSHQLCPAGATPTGYRRSLRGDLF